MKQKKIKKKKKESIEEIMIKIHFEVMSEYIELYKKHLQEFKEMFNV